MKPVNPEFPHACVIRRIISVDSFHDEKSKVIYEGECRRESSANIRTFEQGSSTLGQQVYVDFRVSIPGKWEIQKGDIINMDFGIGSQENGIITRPNVSALKTAKYPQGRTEAYYSISEA